MKPLQLVEAFPPALAIVLKALAHWYDRSIDGKLKAAIPKDYDLVSAQKETIAMIAAEANFRVAYLVSLLGELMTGIAIIFKKGMPILGFAFTVLLILGLGVLNAYNDKPPGWFSFKRRFLFWRVSPATIATIVLITVDLALLGISLLIKDAK